MQKNGPSSMVASAAPARRLELVDRRLVPDRGVIDQDVDAAEPGGDIGGHTLDLGFVADIGEMDRGAAAGRRDLGRHGLGLGERAARVDGDRGAGLGERQRDRPADIARGAGDERDPPLELPHRVSPAEGCARVPRA